LAGNGIESCYAGERFALNIFYNLCEAASLTPELLFRIYCGKNMLNNFRQKHGYKEGTYIKQWDGAEDNDYMLAIVKTLPDSPDFLQSVLDALKAKYLEITQSVTTDKAPV